MALKAVRTTTVLGLLISLNACSGVIEGSENPAVDVAGTPLTFACDPDADLTPSYITRLTRQQYELTMQGLLTQIAGETIADEAMAAAGPSLSAVPADSSAGYALEELRGAAFRGLDQNVSQSHVDAYYRVAASVGGALTADDAHLEALMGECATDADAGNDASCVEGFVRDLARLALRRPPEESEVAFLRDDVYADGGSAGAIDAAGARDVIVALLSSPQFLYHVEDRGPAAGKANHYALTAHELANRLSYFLWQTMPDEELAAAADDGSLLDDEVYRAQAERLFDDPRADATLRDFFSEWLALDKVPHPYRQVGNPRYDAFAGDTVPTPELRQHMIDEVLDLALHTTRAEGGTLSDLFTSDRSFARHEDLASIYGVPPWDGEGEPPRFPDGTRSGILTRAALLSAEGVETHPVLKGVLIRRNILCDSLPPPPPNVNRQSDMEPPYTRREEMEALTMQPGSSCVTCHEAVNPLGFVTETFDGLGRYRTEEPFFAQDGEVMASLPIDTAAAPQVLSGDKTVIQSGVELGRLVAESGKAHACFARHYYRFAARRVEDLASDACALESLRKALVDGNLRDALLSVVLEPSFKMRRAGD